MAIVLDNKVYSEKGMRESMGGGRGKIRGKCRGEKESEGERDGRSGEMREKRKGGEKRRRGKRGGKDSVKTSIIALVGGFILVMGFMVLYYSMAGGIACLAFVGNLFLIVGGIGGFLGAGDFSGKGGVFFFTGGGRGGDIIF
ncbi:hypothetical protein C0160_09530 [Moraxella catarrhalis]|nr:hypothetical protein [Moraxella catarrhalis]